MNLVRLTPDYELTDFDCGDEQFRSYPTIKIGRFAVSKDYRGQQVGRRLMNMK